jgi:hypothetical protein
MAAWFTVVAPFLPDIIQMAKPIFTRPKSPAAAPDLVPKQITELQDAAAQNADAIKLLAGEMQHTIASLRQASVELDQKLSHAYRLGTIALTAAVLGFALAAYALAN